MNRIGIIGGSGVYDLPGLTETGWQKVDTPWGAPSDEIFVGRLGDARLAFLPRHGRGHRIAPGDVNYRANVAALKSLGVTDVLSVSAVGSLRADLPPGTFVVVDQYIDRTTRRESTFFAPGLVAHVSMAHPVCRRLAGHLERALSAEAVPHRRSGTYVAIEGPQFSSFAESQLYRSWNADVIGMTNMPEAKLAREAEICYATLALATDYDCWHESSEDVSIGAILAIIRRNVENAKQIIRGVAKRLPGKGGCGCGETLRHAIITDPKKIRPATKTRLSLLIGKYL